jgi:hypothetical protein
VKEAVDLGAQAEEKHASVSFTTLSSVLHLWWMGGRGGGARTVTSRCEPLRGAERSTGGGAAPSSPLAAQVGVVLEVVVPAAVRIVRLVPAGGHEVVKTRGLCLV